MQLPTASDQLLYGGTFTMDGISKQTVPFKIGNGSLPLKVFDHSFSTRPSGLLQFTGATSTSGSFSGSRSISFTGNDACRSVEYEFRHSDGISYVRYAVKWTPAYSILPDPLEASYCEDASITLRATNTFFNGYHWVYRDQDVIGEPFATSPGTGNTATFTIKDIYGPNYQDKLEPNHPVYVGVRLGSCVALATSASPLNFVPKAPYVTQGTTFLPACANGNGSYRIDAISRNTRSDEKFRLTFKDVHDPIKPFPFVEVKTSDLPVTITGMPAGDYETVIEAYIGNEPTSCGIPIRVPFTIGARSVVTPSITSVPTTCHASPTGSVTITASGGTGSGYQYSIDNGSSFNTSGIFTGLAKGTYLVQVKDANNCVASSTASVSEPDPILIPSPVITQYRGRDLSCFGGSDGQVTLTGVSGGTGPYVYTRDGTNFQGNVFNGLSAGSYTFTVKDANNCLQPAAPVNLVAPPVLTGSVVTTPANCFGESTGKITVTASGGTDALRYSINAVDFQTTPDFNVGANTYIVTIKDMNACTITRSAVVTQPAALIASGSAPVLTCFGDTNGEVTVTATNGTGPYTYSFDGSSFGTSSIFSGKAVGTYTISVKDSKACIGSGTVTVVSNPIITGSIIIQTPISCFGDSNGALNLTPGGGIGPYTYTWSNGATTEDINGLPAGPYNITIKDSKNCTKNFGPLTMTQPNVISASFTNTNLNCFGNTNATIDLTVTGGNGGYTYTWSNGATTQDLNTLPAGTYTVTIKDSKNCSGNATIPIIQPAQLVTALASLQNVLCFGGNSGSISVNTLGGTGAYQYSINNGTTWQPTANFNGLPANNYTVLTKDANNCQNNLNLVITTPPDLILTINNIVNTTCNQNNGSAQASTTGGTPNYTYEWFNSSNSSIATTATITNLIAGSYKVIVTDQNACTKQQTIPISSSNGPQVTPGTIIAATCSDRTDGSATINITGGSTPYVIAWPNGQTTPTATNLQGGDYIVEVRDNTNCLALQTITVPAPPELVINTTTKEDPSCAGDSDGQIITTATGGNNNYTYNWNTGATTPTINNLAAGTYTITVTDIKNCEATETYTLINPLPFTIDLGPDQKICEGMTVTLNAEEDNAMYTWTSANGFTSTNQTVQLTQAGIYTLTIINENGCEATDNFELIYDTNLLKADFLMVSEAHAGDTIVLVDISWPMPEQVEWDYSNDATVIEQTQDYSLIRFDQTGYYTINLLARLAQCSNSYHQGITILEAIEIEQPQGRDNEKLIERLTAYPNPSPEEISIEVDLHEDRTINLELYQAESNKRVYQETLSKEKAHVKALNLSTLPRGMYILYIRAGKEVRIMKIMKQ